MDDFVDLPKYFSPWITPPSSRKNRSANVGSNSGDRGAILLDWVEENTRMKAEKAGMPVAVGRPEAEGTLAMRYERAQGHARSRTDYFYDRNDFSTTITTTSNNNNGNNNNNNIVACSGDFYHLACIGPDDLPTSPRSPYNFGCHGNGRRVVDDRRNGGRGGGGGSDDDDDDNDDDVMEFLEAYRKLPEPTKFQSKVYLEMWREPIGSQGSVFVCPDDSKKFITIHDFSSNQSPSCVVNNYNNNNNNDNNANVNVNAKVQRDGRQVRNDNHNSTTHVDRTAYAKTYAFDRIFMPDEATMDVCIESVAPVMKAVLSGHNGCIVCYGEQDGAASSPGCRGGLVGLTLRWLYALLEEGAHDSLTTYSVKVSAVEFAGTGESIRDLLQDYGMKVKVSDRVAEGDQQPRYIRVANSREARQVLKSSAMARSAPSVNTLFTVHLKQYQARVPSNRRVASLSNQLHVISVSAAHQAGPASNGCTKEGPMTSLATRDNLMQYIGSLMIGQRLPVSSLGRLHVMLQNCILPSNCQCQSSLLLRLGGHGNRPEDHGPTPVRGYLHRRLQSSAVPATVPATATNRDLQRLLNLGTKIYKRRFSRNGHLRHPSHPFHLMNSSASETSSCASSGFSNLRKSRVRMGTRQWSRRVDRPLTSPYDKPTNMVEAGRKDFDQLPPCPVRPNRLELEHRFAPRFGPSRHASSTPTQSPLAHLRWNGSSRSRALQDAIPEQPEDGWQVSTSRFEPSDNYGETWVDWPSSMNSSNGRVDNYSGIYANNYANVGADGRTPAGATVAPRSGASRFVDLKVKETSIVPPTSHQTSFASHLLIDESRLVSLNFRSFLSNQSRSSNFLSRIHQTPPAVRPTRAFDRSDRAPHSILQCSPHPAIGQAPTNDRPQNGLCRGQVAERSGHRKTSLPISFTSPALDRISTNGKPALGNGSSIYESWFEDSVENSTGDLLTESFTAGQSQPDFEVRDSAPCAPNSGGRNLGDDEYEPIRGAGSSGCRTAATMTTAAVVEKGKMELFKRIRRFFVRNPFKRPTSSSSSVSTLPNAFRRGRLPPDPPLPVSCNRLYQQHQQQQETMQVMMPRNSNNKNDSNNNSNVSTCSSPAAIRTTATAPATPSVYYCDDGGKNGVDSQRLANRSRGRERFFPLGIRDYEGDCNDEDDERQDTLSQVESSVANVVCYRRIQLPKRDQGKGDAPFLTPSYFRFSKLLSDGEHDDIPELDNTNNNNNDDYSGNSNNDYSGGSSNDVFCGGRTACNSSCGDFVPRSYEGDTMTSTMTTATVATTTTTTTTASTGTSSGRSGCSNSSCGGGEYVEIKKMLNSDVSTSTLSTVKNVIDDDDDDKNGDGDDDDKNGDVHGCCGKDGGDDDGVARRFPTGDFQTPVGKKRRFTSFIFKGKQMMNRKSASKKERCSIQ